MEIKCPHCGSADHEHFTSTGGEGTNLCEVYVCYNCDEQFAVEYAPIKIVKK